jgi:hypothetical protein
MVAARLVNSTWRRVVVRRSTSGCRARGSHHPHASSTTTVATNRPRVRPLPQPQPPPSETASSRHTSATDNPIPPIRSKRAASAHTGLRHHGEHQCRCHHTKSGGGPEQHVPVEMAGDQGGGGQPESGANAERGTHRRGRPAEPFRRKLVAHDADTQRDNSRRQSLQRAADRQRRQAASQRGRARADRQQQEADQQQAPLAVHVAETLQRAGRPARLTIGPWTHANLDNTPSREALTFALALARGEQPPERAPVRLYVMGEEAWRDFASWPPPGYPSRRMHLQPGGGLSTAVPGESEPDRYRYDPAEPTPAVGGARQRRSQGQHQTGGPPGRAHLHHPRPRS